MKTECGSWNVRDIVSHYQVGKSRENTESITGVSGIAKKTRVVSQMAHIVASGKGTGADRGKILAKIDRLKRVGTREGILLESLNTVAYL